MRYLFLVTLAFLSCMTPLHNNPSDFKICQTTGKKLPILDKQGTKLKLKDVIACAVTNNQEIKKAYELWLSAKNRPDVVSTYPDPKLGVSYFAEEIQTKNGPLQAILTLSQRLPWFGKLNTKKTIAQRHADALKQNYLATKLEVISKVKQTYYELWWINRAIELTDLHIKLVRQFEKVVRTMYSAGKVPQQDVLKAQVEISKLQNDLETFADLKTTVIAKLNALLNRPINALIGKPEVPEFKEFKIGLEKLFKIALQNSPELEFYRQLIKKQRQEIKLANLGYYPDFTLGIKYQSIGSKGASSVDRGQDAWGVMLSANLPLGISKRRASVEEAKRKTLSERFAYNDALNTLQFNVKDAYIKVKIAQSQVNLYKQNILPRARQTVKISEQNYIDGTGSFLDLIDSQRLLLNFQLACERAKVDFYQNLARLEELIGKELEEVKP